jgi:hypothetical protein
LRTYARGLMKKESVVIPFPEGVWDVEGAEYGVNVVLFTLAEIDELWGSPLDSDFHFRCWERLTMLLQL